MKHLPVSYEEAPEIKELAEQIIDKLDDVGHVNIKEVLFLKELNTIGSNALARCYRLTGKPYQFFTNHKWCIVVFQNMIDYMTENQLKILIWHELKHIHPFLDKSVDHNVKDFQSCIEVDPRWSMPNTEVGDILKG
jgi:hypothetical protein